MKIVTCNIPESYIDVIKKLTGEGGLYPSQSELIRVACRKFLLKELRMAKNMAEYVEPESVPDDPNIVRVPTIKNNTDNEPVREFKTYKVVKKLTTPLPEELEAPLKASEHTSEQFKHAKPKNLIRYTKDFGIDLILSFINEKPGISDKELSNLTGFRHQTVRNNVNTAVRKYGINVKIEKSKRDFNGRIDSFTLLD